MNFLKSLTWFLSILLLYSNILIAQNNIGFDEIDLVTKDQSIYVERKVGFDSDMNLFLVGTFSQKFSIANDSIQTTNNDSVYVGSRGIYLVKFDSNKNYLNTVKVAQSDSLFSFSVNFKNQNEIYISIDFASKIIVNNDTIISKGSSDILLLKYNLSMQLQFIKHLGNVNGESVAKEGVSMDNLGNVYLAGSFNSTWTNNFPNYKLGFDGDTIFSDSENIFLVKLDSFGNTLWAKSFGGGGNDFATNIVSNDGFIYMLATLYNAGAINDVGGTNVTFPVTWQNPSILTKLDSNGNVLWIRRFGNSDGFGGSPMIVSSLSVTNGHIFFSGHAVSNNQTNFHFDGGPNLVGNNTWNYFIAAYDTAGNFKWNKISKSDGDEYILQMATDGEGNLFAVGKMSNTLTFAGDTLLPFGNDDAFVCSYDSSGNFRWATNGGGVNTDVGNGIALDANEKVWIVGGTTSSNGCFMGNDTLFPPASQSTLFFASIDSIPKQTPNSIHNYEMGQAFEMFPNPAQERLNIQLNASFSNGTISIHNAIGQLVQIVEVTKPENQISIRDLPNGLYFVEYQNQKITNTQKLVVQH